MNDYTTNGYCDFLWIGDLHRLKRNAKNMFEAKFTKNNRRHSIAFVNVIIFGTIVEIKQLGLKKFLYNVDDGTGVIACVHNEEQFDEAISIIESEQCDVVNLNLTLKQDSERTYVSDTSTDDSVFNEKSIQHEELSIIKTNLLLGLQSIWNDLYDSYTNLLAQYKIGDVVLIEGKLYSYFNVNQVYINIIRSIDLSEEIVKISRKLKDGFDVSVEASGPPPPPSQNEVGTSKRMSGLMTFDHIHHLNVRFPNSRDIRDDSDQNVTTPKCVSNIVPLNVESTMTFDTLDCKK